MRIFCSTDGHIRVINNSTSLSEGFLFMGFPLSNTPRW